MHGKFNEREMNPNPHINFVSALPAPDPTEQESARQLLRALAAQVRPIMKSHGFSISSLEEVIIYWFIRAESKPTMNSTTTTMCLLGGTGMRVKLSVSPMYTNVVVRLYRVHDRTRSP